jgi:hypothetical protein
MVAMHTWLILSNKIYQTFQDLSKQNIKNNIENNYIYYGWSIFNIYPVTLYIYEIKMSDISRFIYLSRCDNGTRLPDTQVYPLAWKAQYLLVFVLWSIYTC